MQMPTNFVGAAASIALAATAAVHANAQAEAQGLPDPLFFVKNNTAVNLTCSVRAERGNWSRPFSLPRGAEWSRMDPSANRYFIRCSAPVRRATYALLDGVRYSFLRQNPRAEIRLHRIIADDSER